jgi:tetratricopeptide (TPR) repeat protein
MGLGRTLSAQEKHAEAGDALVASVGDSKDHMAAWHLYYAAVEYAKAGSKDKAIGTLEKAYAAGYPNKDLSTEPAFAAIASDPRVKQLVAKK